MNATQIAERIEALGPWFQNLDLNGVRTAPGHFLGDYPADKFARFAHLLPADLTDEAASRAAWASARSPAPPTGSTCAANPFACNAA